MLKFLFPLTLLCLTACASLSTKPFTEVKGDTAQLKDLYALLLPQECEDGTAGNYIGDMCSFVDDDAIRAELSKALRRSGAQLDDAQTLLATARERTKMGGSLGTAGQLLGRNVIEGSAEIKKETTYLDLPAHERAALAKAAGVTAIIDPIITIEWDNISSDLYVSVELIVRGGPDGKDFIGTFGCEARGNKGLHGMKPVGNAVGCATDELLDFL